MFHCGSVGLILYTYKQLKKLQLLLISYTEPQVNVFILFDPLILPSKRKIYAYTIQFKIYLQRQSISKSFRTESITKYTLTFGITCCCPLQRVMAKLTRLTHKIAIQLHLVAESCTICRCRSRRPVRKLLDTPLYVVSLLGTVLFMLYLYLLCIFQWNYKRERLIYNTDRDNELMKTKVNKDLLLKQMTHNLPLKRH
jgi:hypothetical protein